MSTLHSVPPFDFDELQVKVGFPGLLPEQNLAYRATMRHWLGRLASRIDLSGLGSIEITADYQREITRRNLDAVGVGHVATSYVSLDGLVGKPASAHVILDLVPHIGLFDITADQHLGCLHSLATAVGNATSSWLFHHRYGFSWGGAQHDLWHEVARDCLVAFVTGNLTHGIGPDFSEHLLKQQTALAEEIKSACAEWLRVEADEEEYADYGYPAWDMSCCYSSFFVSTARWLGVQTAKCSPIKRDYAHGIGLHCQEWPSLFLDLLLCIQRRWVKAESASTELARLAGMILQVVKADISDRYPQALDFMAGVTPSDNWPAMLVWPMSSSRKSA